MNMKVSCEVLIRRRDNFYLKIITAKCVERAEKNGMNRVIRKSYKQL